MAAKKRTKRAKRATKATRKQAKGKATKATKATKGKKVKTEVCLCGCGQPVKPRRQFLQGHDMRLKSLVIKVQKGDANKSDIPAVAWPLLSSTGVGGLKLRK